MKLFNKEANFSHHFGALAATLFAVALSPVQAGEEIFSLESSWDQPEPRLSLRGTEAGEISNSSLVRYGLETKVEAHCYLIKLDARGDAWLWGGDACAPGSGPIGQRTLLPGDSAIEMQSAVGRESLRAFLMPEPISLTTPASDNIWRPLDESSLSELTNQLSRTAEAGNLAVATLEYDVLEDSGELQFTTRAILDQVANASSAGGSGSVLTSFNVDAIRFEFGSALPTPSGTRQMNAFGEALRDPMLADKRLIIAGHTDDVGATQFNMELSRARSEAVKAYFKENFGVAASRMETQAFGESQPVMPNDSEGNRAKNRRVEITFLY